MRIKIIRVIIFTLLFVVGLSLFVVQVIRGQYYYNLSVNNRIRVVPLEGPRGRVIDRNGIILVDNRLAFNVSVIPQDIQDSEALFGYLGEVLEVEKRTLQQRFFQKKVTPFAPVVIAQDVDKKVAMILEENKFRFPGLYIQESIRRHYPFRNIGAHVLGHVGKINRSEIEKLKDYGYTQQSIIGKDGVEEYYDAYLKGSEGGQQIEVNSRGQQVRLLSIRQPQSGEDIRLTIDQRIQTLAADVLGDHRGSIIVMDLETGKILGMVNFPSYDPNIFDDSRLKRKARSIFVDVSAPLLNRAIQGLYPPGSVFKMVVTASGLMTGKITPGTEYLCQGSYKLGRRRFRCAHTHGTQDLIQGIAHSCNVYFYNLGLVVGPDVMHRFGKLLGLGSLSHIDLPYEKKGQVPSPLQRKMQQNRGWYKGDTLNFAIGQGDVLVTPIQLLRMMATVARKGREVQPHLITSIGSREIIKFATVRKVRISEESFKILQKGLYGAVHDASGTARLLNMEGFTVSGKTGTAQSVPGRRHHAWFVGYDTSGKEKIVFCVFLEHGGSSYNAVRLASQLLQRMRSDEIL